MLVLIFPTLSICIRWSLRRQDCSSAFLSLFELILPSRAWFLHSSYLFLPNLWALDFYRSAGLTVYFTLRCHPALVVRKNDITILRHLASLFFGRIQFLKNTCCFRNIKRFTGKGYWPFAQPTTWRARCCSSSDLSPGTCPARLNLPRTAVPADIASRVTKARKPPHHDEAQPFNAYVC